MLKLNNKPIAIDHFPDGGMLVKESVPYDFAAQKDHVIEWHFENNEEMVALIFLTRHIQAHGGKNIDLVMPYIPNARQDRVKTDEDVFTLKYFAELINDLHFRSVTVLDPHSNVSEALIDRLIVRTPKLYVEKVISILGTEGLLMFYPDEGAMKRYSGLVQIPYAFGIKKRDWATGKIKGLDVAGEIDAIAGSRILIVDDICSKGGTFVHSSEKLKELGAKEIYLYVSHCENTILRGRILTDGLIDRVFTTDSIFTEHHERIEVLSND